MQTDPIGTKDQMNLYGYVGSDPLNATDPTGLQMREEIQMEMAKEAEAISKMSPAELQAYKKAEIERGAAVLNVVIDLTPGLGDGKAIGEAIESPTVANVASATIGVAPGGDLVGRGIKAIGRWGEEQAVKEIVSEGGTIISRGESLSTRSGSDIVYKDANGKFVCCEVKAGKTAETAPLSPLQAETKAAVEGGEVVTTKSGVPIEKYEERRYPLK